MPLILEIYTEQVRRNVWNATCAAVGADPVDAVPVDAGIAGALVSVGDRGTAAVVLRRTLVPSWNALALTGADRV